MAVRIQTQLRSEMMASPITQCCASWIAPTGLFSPGIRLQIKRRKGGGARRPHWKNKMQLTLQTLTFSMERCGVISPRSSRPYISMGYRAYLTFLLHSPDSFSAGPFPVVTNSEWATPDDRLNAPKAESLRGNVGCIATLHIHFCNVEHATDA